MKVEVVNVRSFPFEYPTPYIYVGRYMPGKFKGHALGNPFKLPKRATAQDRIDLLATYDAWLTSLPDCEQQILALTNRVLSTGLPLGCWCHPEPCHAHVLRDRVQAVIDANYCAVCGFPWGHMERCAACEAKPLP